MPTMPGEPTRTAASGGGTHRVTRSLFSGALLLFVSSTLFDPADKIFGLKLPLYLLCWCIGAALCFGRRERIKVPSVLLVYILLMVTIPLLSISYYFLVDGSDPFAGFLLLKAYLFISMALLLYVTRTDLLPTLCAVLTTVSAGIYVLSTVVLVWPVLFLPVYVWGNEYGVFSIDNRDYGSGLVLFQMYFVTSPMLAIAIAYYWHQAKFAIRRRSVYGLLVALNLGAMILAGTRNNMLAAIVLPLSLLVLHAKRKGLAVSVIGAGVVGGLLLLSTQIGILLDPLEPSNRTKLGVLGDYATLFGNVNNMLFGRGLGAYEWWTGRGYYFITELTYFEILRNFGFLLGGVMILLLVSPIVYAFLLRRTYKEKSVIVGYAVYLAMCISNPYLFSSMGMLILSVIVANISLFESAVRRDPTVKSTHSRSSDASLEVRV